MTQTTPQTAGADTDWFTHDRFGLFIHWGIYSAAARHEWVKQRERITDEDYRRYYKYFCPDLYDPEAWAREAKNAGMKYLVVTTKHHDGFCLWDSDLTDYKVTNTPWGRDLLAPLVEAFRAEGMKIGFYHSLIDWHHPEFPVDGLHSRRDDREYIEANRDRDIAKYREYLHGQTRELLTRFGKIDVMWFDFSYPNRVWGGKGKKDWGSEELAAMVRELQPGIIINDRLEIGGDLKTPEQYQPNAWPEVNGERVMWEACQTLNGSWGYDRDNLDYKPVDLLVRMLVDTVSKGGNLLLNVGPNARGEFDPRSLERLRGLGEWMRLHERSVRGCTAVDEYSPPSGCRYTRNGDRMYLHLFEWPFRHVHLEGLAGKVEYAQLLNDASEVETRVVDPDQPAQNTTMGGITEGTLTLELPVQRPPVSVPVVELFLEG